MVGRRECSVGAVWALSAAMRTLHDLARCCCWTGSVQRLIVGLLSDNKHYLADQTEASMSHPKKNRAKRAKQPTIYLYINLSKPVLFWIIAIFLLRTQKSWMFRAGAFSVLSSLNLCCLIQVNLLRSHNSVRDRILRPSES